MGTNTGIITTTMTDSSGLALVRLMAWLSPAFPVGSFSYSHGLERAVHDGLIEDADGLAEWIAALLGHGSAWNDAVLFAESWRRAKAGEAPREVAELAEALAGSKERHMEAMLQGTAFLKAAATWPASAIASLGEECPYCVAVGATAGAHAIALEDALAAFLQAFSANLAQAAIRLGVIGQTEAVALLARLEPEILATATRAARSTLDELGSATLASEIAAMRHEEQYSRLFRS
ncbi:urease accessory protein UreF [Aquamicrobium sp. LC103]|uniref:urease accessory protein UreF n=1 Tax=Aquamicrobium sp. LC103 TaxID=1120658 RepID=UPI0014855A62|nr:urease accessory protein UreF [Aquamicrobium sp. LC103]